MKESRSWNVSWKICRFVETGCSNLLQIPILKCFKVFKGKSKNLRSASNKANKKASERWKKSSNKWKRKSKWLAKNLRQPKSVWTSPNKSKKFNNCTKTYLLRFPIWEKSENRGNNTFWLCFRPLFSNARKSTKMINDLISFGLLRLRLNEFLQIIAFAIEQHSKDTHHRNTVKPHPVSQSLFSETKQLQEHFELTVEEIHQKTNKNQGYFESSRLNNNILTSSTILASIISFMSFLMLSNLSKVTVVSYYSLSYDTKF